MSYATWQKEFYPTTAATAATRGTLAAVRHSLRKWRGLTAKSLAAHRMRLGGDREVTDGERWLYIDMDSCALCQRFVARTETCYGCPLYAVLGKRCDDDGDAPFNVWGATTNPAPMIAALQEAEQWVLTAQQAERRNGR